MGKVTGQEMMLTERHTEGKTGLSEFTVSHQPRHGDGLDERTQRRKGAEKGKRSRQVILSQRLSEKTNPNEPKNEAAKPFRFD
jgi:hypothetical protein